jgi:hypothetical protein
MMKKRYAEGGGVREGKSRFGDDVRKRAMKTIEARGLSDKEAAKLLDREPKKPSAEAKRVAPPRKIEAKPLEPKKTAEESPKPKPDARPDKSLMEKSGYLNAKGGAIKMASGGSVSKRADGCAIRGKTKGRMI